MSLRSRFAGPAGALLLASLAYSEDGSDVPFGSPGRVTGEPPPLEEIVVTAQKREEKLRDVPLSVIVFDGEDFREDAVDNLHELAERAPNVRFTTNPCCTVVLVRGFGTPFATSAFEPAVGLAVDGLSLPRDLFMAAPLYDLERFEVLRGPQGTFFGKNTSAGLFNVVTARPGEKPAGFLLARAGNLGTHHLEGAAGGALGEIVRLRLSGIVSRQAGDVDNTRLDVDEPGAEQRGGRVTLELSPVENLELRVIGSASITRSRLHLQLRSLSESSLDFLRRYDPRVEDDGFDHQSSMDVADAIRQKTYRLQTNAAYELPGTGVRLDGIIGLAGVDIEQPLDIDASPADILRLTSPNDLIHDQLSAELRVSGFVPLGMLGAVDWIGGVFLFQSDLDSRARLRAGEDFDDYLLSAPGFETVTGVPPPGGVGFPDLGTVVAIAGLDPSGVDTLEGDGARFLLDQATRSQALFGHLSWQPIPRWTVGLGGRVTFERKRARLSTVCLSPGLVCAALGIEEVRLTRRRREADFSPKASLQYAPFEELTLFATRTQGFKGGGFNRLAFSAEGAELGAEEAVSWEVGAHGTLLSEGLSYRAALFQMEVDDLQLQSIAGGTIEVRNAASARSRGIELDLRWLGPWQPFHVDARGALLEARFRKFPDAPAPASSDDAVQDISGRPLPFAPEWHLVFSPGLRLPFTAPRGFWPVALLSRHVALVAGLDVVYRSRHFLDLDLDPATRQEGYPLLHFRLGLSSGDDSWSLGLFLENLTDTDAHEFATDSVTFPGGFTVLQEFQRRYAFGIRAAW